MVEGFEKYTHQLTPSEIEIARSVWRILNRQTSYISNSSICKQLEDNYGISTNGPRVRKMINFMHINGHLPNLIATSKGYYFAKSRLELSKYAKSLGDRISAINARRMRTLEDLKNWKE